MTIPRGPFLVSRIGDHSLSPSVSIQNVSVCTFKTSPCAPANRSTCVYNMLTWYRYTQRRCESTHGGFQRATPTHATPHTRTPRRQPQRLTTTPTNQTATPQHHQQQHHHHHPRSKHTRVLGVRCVAVVVVASSLGTFMWSQANGEHTGAARRRRERRLRQFLRQERLSVAMALAESNHHSAPRGTEDGQGLGEWSARRTTSQGYWTPPLPQTAATVGYVAAPGPLLVVPSLAGGDSVDGTALRFLLKQTLALQKEEEEERRRKELEEEDRSARESLERAQRFLDRAASKRKRKKRKKKKLPRAPRPRQGCRRLCDHQRHVPAVRISVVTRRQVPTVHSFILPVQLLDKVLDMPVVVLRQVPGLMVQKTVEPPAVAVHLWSSTLHFVPQRQNLMVQTFLRIIEIPQLPLVIRWSMSLLFWSCRFSGAAVEKTVFLLLFGRPRCSASWLVWLTRTVMPRHRLCLAGFAGDDTARAVFGQTSTEASGRIYHILREREPRSRGRFSPWISGHYFYKQYLTVASDTEAFGRISGVFYVKVDTNPEVDFRAGPGAFRTRKSGHYSYELSDDV